MKKIAIITINFNNAEGLKKTMDSVFSQTSKEFEFIIIDGGSSDGSKALIENNKDKITYWVSEKDEGIYHAQNKGLLKSTADYCLFLNSGDILANEMVISHFISELHDTDIVYGDLITEDKVGKQTALSSPDKLDVYHLMISTLWHPTAFIKRELFQKFGLYDQKLKVTGDYEFFIRVILKYNASTKHIKIPVCIFDLKGISNSTELTLLQTKERKLSWEANFSPAIIESMETYVKILRSREYKLAQSLRRIINPILGRK